ncbi:hypothetical protein ACWD1Y_42355 [Streptomyces sp. NPDC002814]
MPGSYGASAEGDLPDPVVVVVQDPGGLGGSAGAGQPAQLLGRTGLVPAPGEGQQPLPGVLGETQPRLGAEDGREDGR